MRTQEITITDEQSLIDYNKYIDLLENSLNITYAEEQKDLIRNIHTSVISNSLPGVGKSTTIISGVFAYKFARKKPMSRVLISSFSKASVGDLQFKFTEIVNKTYGQGDKPEFRTVDSLLFEIARMKYGASFRTTKLMGSEKERVFKMLETVMVDYIKLDLNNYTTTVIYNCIQQANRNFVYDLEELETKSYFKRTKLTISQFSKLRHNFYVQILTIGRVPFDLLPAIVLDILQDNPSILEAIRSRYDLVIVDEYQDTSLDKMQVLNLIAKELVLVGDINQQIYGFNGASSQVLKYYKEAFPLYKEIPLIQSFRCSKAVSTFAANMIAFNGNGGEDIKPARDGGLVNVSSNLTASTIAKDLLPYYDKNDRSVDGKYLIIYRNNYSAYRIVDRLYKLGVPVRTKDSMSILDGNYTRHIFNLFSLLEKPADISSLRYLLYFDVEEMQGIYNPHYKHPLTDIMYADPGKPFYEFKFAGKDKLFITLGRISKHIQSKDLNYTFANDVKAIMPYFEDAYIRRQQQFNEDASAVKIVKLIEDIAGNKTYGEVYTYESTKHNKITEWIGQEKGVRCYTIHNSKGLEADIVLLADASDKVLTSEKELAKYVGSKCISEAAESIVQSRNLCYVAITRAKEEFHILHEIDGVANILVGNNMFSELDLFRENYNPNYDSIAGFSSFTKGEY